MAEKELSEAEKMRRVPGIIFADGAAGRRARIAGTGLDVFEIIKGYLDCDRDLDCLTECFHWLTAEQLRAALNYYAQFAEEIDERLAREWELEDELIRSKGLLPPAS